METSKNTKVIGNKRVPIIKSDNEIANENKMAASVFCKSDNEKAEAATAKNQFKHNGLKEWNDRNRPGNNKKVS